MTSCDSNDHQTPASVEQMGEGDDWPISDIPELPLGTLPLHEMELASQQLGPAPGACLQILLQEFPGKAAAQSSGRPADKGVSSAYAQAPKNLQET